MAAFGSDGVGYSKIRRGDVASGALLDRGGVVSSSAWSVIRKKPSNIANLRVSTVRWWQMWYTFAGGRPNPRVISDPPNTSLAIEPWLKEALVQVAVPVLIVQARHPRFLIYLEIQIQRGRELALEVRRPM